MENAELDVALEELENRLERLRALYEQYFMGIERIEPAIPRKDIDRRIYVLRREKIRNTAKRFKLQTIISRYNTFQQYWQRICREIEAGTYKRHVIKAERIAPGKMLTIAARKRLGRHAFDDVEPEPPAVAAAAAPAVEEKRPESSVPAPPSVPRPAPTLGALGAKAGPPAKPLPPPKPGARPAKADAPPAPEPAPPPAANKPFESLNLDMDFMGDWDPTAGAGKGPKIPVVPARPFGQALARPLGAAPVKPAAARAAPATTPVAKPATPLVVPQPAPSGAAEAPRRAAPLGLPAAQKAPLAPSGPTPPQAPGPVAAAPKPMSTPLAAAPAVPPATKLGAAPITRPVAPKAAPAADLTDARVRELHARLVEAKRQTKDAAAVSVEGLAKSLKATEAKLREQHKNRKIDFDVVIKDGRAVLKPIVR